jgi:arginase
MAMTRRTFALAAGASMLAAARASQQSAPRKDVVIVLAPTNLGLRPEGAAQLGTWRAPQALMDAGLAGSLSAADIVRLERPDYDFSAQAGTRIRNGLSIRDFSLAIG